MEELLVAIADMLLVFKTTITNYIFCNCDYMEYNGKKVDNKVVIL